MSARSKLVRALPCIACQKQGVRQMLPTEEHHLLSGNRRRGDDFSIPLCVYHHRGEPPAACSASQMECLAGPSFARASKRFRTAYGTDDELLAETNRHLGLETVLNGGW